MTQLLYSYSPDANSFAGIGFSTDDDDIIRAIHSSDEPLDTTWRELCCEEFEDNPPQHGDFPSLSNYRRIPVMSDKAWNALRPLIGYCCEALPIIHPIGGQYYIIHVMETLDCLDEQASELSRSKIDGRVNRIHQYAFVNERVAGKHIFKLPRESGGELLIDDEFRRVVERNGLKGLKFQSLPLIDSR